MLVHMNVNLISYVLENRNYLCNVMMELQISGNYLRMPRYFTRKAVGFRNHDSAH